MLIRFSLAKWLISQKAPLLRQHPDTPKAYSRHEINHFTVAFEDHHYDPNKIRVQGAERWMK